MKHERVSTHPARRPVVLGREQTIFVMRRLERHVTREIFQAPANRIRAVDKLRSIVSRLLGGRRQ